ncbi:hypothetical protein H4R21_001714 [Coemansia helicoidea]|uniref:Uncharacterized protein n=1 Tax=Coemansia helicoidea TaxID=1286919 RepID=A0ACC1LBJ1_9FUNG|nr:hypothetical protein H4R21_001714 [Coemansia helicoidea]
MAENQPAQTEPARGARANLAETPYAQKTAAAAAATTRKTVLSQHSHKRLNQHAAATGPGAEKEPKKMPKMDIPVSLDIDPFSTDSYTDPQGAMDRMLSAKGGDGGDERQAPATAGGKAAAKGDAAAGSLPAVTPRGGEKDAGALLARVRKTETEILTLKHQLLETKADLKAAEARLREKDAIIKDQEERIDELVESRVPRDDMDEVVAENLRLQQELRDNEALLADCQKLLEEYVAADAQPA